MTSQVFAQSLPASAPRRCRNPQPGRPRYNDKPANLPGGGFVFPLITFFR
jgi:hypothetical protein